MESNHDILLNFFPRLRNKHCKSCSCYEQEVTIIAMCNVCTARSAILVIRCDRQLPWVECGQIAGKTYAPLWSRHRLPEEEEETVRIIVSQKMTHSTIDLDLA